MLRKSWQAGGDAPIENKSAWALEMDDARAVLRDATDRSLVTLDEIGRGTEAHSGAGVAGGGTSSAIKKLEAAEKTGATKDTCVPCNATTSVRCSPAASEE